MSNDFQLRIASFDDLPDIVGMLADDFLGGTREKVEETISENYIRAFHEIENDPNNELIVAVLNGKIVGTFQLTYTPSLSFQGGKLCTVESVRVDSNLRGQGIGREMMLWAIERAKEKGCVSMQLTTHKERENAHRFYDKLGFRSTHLGMKLKLK
jgi:ribosomal protein S18 acetylase RimI-like enzyme